MFPKIFVTLSSRKCHLRQAFHFYYFFTFYHDTVSCKVVACARLIRIDCDNNSPGHADLSSFLQTKLWKGKKCVPALTLEKPRIISHKDMHAAVVSLLLPKDV
ncbi:hypothetical protein AMECASPLE_019663 [Ameca splendens]|uniref:Uncharacterized protein n=1 Tax=Ameca splendens TaxID=208324 RepID=A0ABV0XS61_9TELE